MQKKKRFLTKVSQGFSIMSFPLSIIFLNIKCSRSNKQFGPCDIHTIFILFQIFKFINVISRLMYANLLTNFDLQLVNEFSSPNIVYTYRVSMTFE